MTLYLKYRATNLDELDIENVRDTLKKIISSGNIPHAFLFSGPKGTGKTSAARILAKIINCEHLDKNNVPCNQCEQCTSITKGNNLDVIELDAASHRGIDDIRILKDAVKLSPLKAKKKIYIIDEAHMLTAEASNALLKTLEEPPMHIIFILATTNPEKLIDTIRSRTTIVSFTKATISEIVRSLRRVTQGESINASEESLEIIAKNADGSFRDAIKILEQLIAEKIELSEKNLEEYFLNKNFYNTDKFIKYLAERDIKKLLAEIENAVNKGVSVEVILKNLISRIRSGLLAKVGVGGVDILNLEKDELVYLIEILSEASRDLGESLIEELPLELAVIKWCEKSKDLESEGQDLKENEISESLDTKDKESQISNSSQDLKSELKFAKKISNESANEELVLGGEVWKSILSSVRPINASIEALLRAAKPVDYSKGVLTLAVYYRFHKERLEEVSHRRVLEEVVTKILKSPTRIVCTLTEPPARKIIEEAKSETILTESKDKDIVKMAEEIFSN